MRTSPARSITPDLRRLHKTVSAKDRLQLLGDHTAILALLFHDRHDTIRIGQDRQIVLNRKCPSGISNIDPILRSAIRTPARADDSSVSPSIKPSRPSSRNLTFVPSGILTHFFPLRGQSSFGCVLMIPLVAHTSYPVSRYASLQVS